MSKESYIVTGGAGFIGSNLVRELVTRKKSVTVLDDLSTGRMSNLMGLRKKINFIHGSICDPNIIVKALKGHTHLFHLAAIPSVPLSVQKPLETSVVNVNGTIMLLEAAVKAKLKHFLFASSSAIYGDRSTLPHTEDAEPAPCSPYATAKLASEYYCQTFSQLYPLRTTALRFFNVYGPYQDPLSHYAAVIPLFIQAAMNNKPLPIFGDGSQTRDFTYVGDVVDGLLRASRSARVNGDVLNLACGKALSVKQLATMISAAMHVDLRIRYLSKRKGDILHSVANVKKIKSRLNFKPSVTPASGIAHTIEWFRTQHDVGNIFYQSLKK